MAEEQWPPALLNPGDTFVSEREPDFHLNACIGRQLADQDGPHTYADGFRLAARSLVAKLMEGSDVEFAIDLVVYPVVFLYRHHIELRLKLLIVGCRSLLNEKSEWPTGHRLDRLWYLARPLAERALPHLNWSQNGTVTELLAELSELDPKGEAARYSHNREGEKHFRNLRVLNIRHFADVAERLSEYLDLVVFAVGMTDERRREYEADMMWE